MKKSLFAVFVSALIVNVAAFADAPPAPDYQYTVKGIIRAIPAGQGPQREIIIRHEEVPDYRDDTGKVVGMHSMTMPFYLSPDLSPEGLKVGDEVEFTLATWLKPQFKELVTKIGKIPNS